DYYYYSADSSGNWVF
nr:immunoglobulin light chain junction region [Macaca mulatta]MOV66315.1 immunoglobulin light chain junction region [Macaca mulatta]MOV67110.1 immunoglobulin light chain junction region [Macaca mulatta]MOV69652.1 immunoglobulin light chain junction region [Macaca mulatta]MOV71007.1 immunoglobulin light chain junction region [Macaca mulatta]